MKRNESVAQRFLYAVPDGTVDSWAFCFLEGGSAFLPNVDMHGSTPMFGFSTNRFESFAIICSNKSLVVKVVTKGCRTYREGIATNAIGTHCEK